MILAAECLISLYTYQERNAVIRVTAQCDLNYRKACSAKSLLMVKHPLRGKAEMRLVKKIKN
jgi:hypothetical protein